MFMARDAPSTPTSRWRLLPFVRILRRPWLEARSSRSRRLALGALALAACSALIWQAGEWGRRTALVELRDTATTSLSLHAAALRSDLEKYRAMSFVLSHDTDVAMLLSNPSSADMVERVNRKLEALGDGTRAAAVYVVDRAGRTLAASNWRLATSFVGQDYGFRVYVQAALSDGTGEQFSSGTVSQRAGYYLARRVEAGSGTAGVVVVKVEFDELERVWQGAGGHVLATDANGVVLLTDDPEWRFSTLRPLPETMRATLRDQMQYGSGAPLTPLPIARRPGAEREERIVRLQLSGMMDVEASFLEVSAPVAETAWRLHRLEPLDPTVRHTRNRAMLIAFLTVAATGSAVLLLLHRRRRARRLLEDKERARVELERRVAERTAELSRSNALLRGEIEERLRAEADLRHAQDELVHAAKLATLGQTAASIAHEVNQPLAALRTYAENAAVLLTRGRAEDARANLASISALTERIARITQDLKRFARKASGELGPVSVQASVAAALALLDHRLRQSRVRVRAELPEAEIHVLAEPTRLEQVLVNLLQNAIDALKDVAAPAITVAVETTGERVVLVVSDNGPGIRAEDVPRAFSAFFTTKSDGLGLGLAISHGIVQDFGGLLSYRQRTGGGAAFAIDLRRAP